VEPVRRRHAAEDAPRSRPVRTRGRTPQRLLAGTTLLAIAMAPVLARSTSGLGMHDAVAAELAANPGQTEDTLEQLSRGGILAGLSTPSPTTPGALGAPDTSSSTGSSSGAPSRTGSQTGGGQTGGEPVGTATGTQSSSPALTSAPTSSDSPAGSPATGGETPGPTTPENQSQAPVDPVVPEPTLTPSAPEEIPTPAEPELTDAPPSAEDTTTPPRTTDAATPTSESSDATGNVVETHIATPTDTLGG
jgi:hypothetical protein